MRTTIMSLLKGTRAVRTQYDSIETANPVPGNVKHSVRKRMIIV